MVGSKRLGYEIIIIISYLRPRPLGLKLYHLFQPQQSSHHCVYVRVCVSVIFISFALHFSSGFAPVPVRTISPGRYFRFPKRKRGRIKRRGSMKYE